MKMTETISKKDIKSWVEEAVTVFKCPEGGCGATFSDPARYMDHRIQEGFAKAVEEVKAPDPEKTVLECKDGICKLIEEHVEEVYGLERKAAAPAEEPTSKGETVDSADANSKMAASVSPGSEEAPEEEVKGLWDDMEDEPEEPEDG